MADGQEVVVLGRISYDMNPLQERTPLEEVVTFERSVGGFAGNVATGLARLGVRTLIVSGVGDDPHGRYIRAWLRSEGVDDTGLLVHPLLRTALSFYESWPPDHFPITLFRSPSAPDWELDLSEALLSRIAAAPTLVISGTGLARPQSLSLTRELIHRRRGMSNVFDLDWRPMAWLKPWSFPAAARQVLEETDVVVGGDAEFAAAQLSPDDVAKRPGRLVVVKHGPAGVSLLNGREHRSIPPIAVETRLGLGAGDAFLAAFVAALSTGCAAEEAVRRGNAAGAIVASRPMCSPAMPTPPEIDLMLAGRLPAPRTAGAVPRD